MSESERKPVSWRSGDKFNPSVILVHQQILFIASTKDNQSPSSTLFVDWYSSSQTSLLNTTHPKDYADRLFCVMPGVIKLPIMNPVLVLKRGQISSLLSLISFRC